MTNAIIEDVSIEIEDHGLLTFFVQLRFSDGGQAYGGYAIERVSCLWITRLLSTFRAQKLSELRGKVARVEFKGTTGWRGRIGRIGHAVEDRWFDYEAVVTELQR